MKIACLSDQHGYLPEIPDADLLLLAGDYVFTRKGDWERQLRFINGGFHRWVEEISSRMPVAFCAGNHDEVFEKHYRLINPFPDNVHYLENSGVSINGFNIWGSPENLRFYDWSFNREPWHMKQYWDMVPLDTDILVCHQPPYDCADYVFPDGNIGCRALRDRILEVKPKLVVTGHLHSNHGVHMLNETVIVSASHVDEEYKNPREIIIVDFP